MTTYVQHLFEWADLLTAIAQGMGNSAADLKASLRRVGPRFLDAGRDAGRKQLKDADVVYLAAAEDKYERARGVVGFARQNSDLGRAWKSLKDH